MGEGSGQGRETFCQVSCLSQDLGNLDLRKAIDNFIEAPLEDIIKAKDIIVPKIKEFLGEEHKRMLDEAVAWCKKIVDVVLKIKKA